MQPHENYNPYAPPSADVDQGLQLQSGDDYVLAERGTRLGAALIDGLLAVAAAAPRHHPRLHDLLRHQRHDQPRRRRDDGYGVIAVGALMVLMILAFMGYQWYLIATTGQSLAKRWLGIKIVRVDGSPVGFVNGVILRNWVISAMLSDPDRRDVRRAREPADDLR
jgi:uncharacterized RDD family membrane protein YckC